VYNIFFAKLKKAMTTMFFCVNPQCQDDVPRERYLYISKLCMVCGEKRARQQTHCVVPLAKGAYQPIINPELLKGLGKYHNMETV
jgi:hypothetical protein